MEAMSTGRTKRRRIYDITSKKQIIAYAEKHGNRAAGRFYNIPESCIRLWRKNLTETATSQGKSTSAELPEMPVPVLVPISVPVAIVSKPETEQVNNITVEVSSKASIGSKANSSSGTSPSSSKFSWYCHLDEDLRRYVNQLYEEGSPVLIEEILLKAYDIIMSLNISRHQLEVNREWVKTFLKYRSGVSCRISKSPRVVKEIETKLFKYHSVITQLRKQHNYPLNQIGNAHQVKIFLDYPPSNDKCVTVILCATADGCKLPPFIVFKCDNVLNKMLPRNVIVRTGENGSMTSKLLTEWYKLVWGCRRGMEYNPRALLTIDHSISHLLAEDWLVEGNTDLIVIPKGMNLFPQPLNVHVQKSFKDNLRWECEKWLLSQGKLKSASASLILYWIAGAWKHVPEELIKNSFENCHLSSDVESLEAGEYTISESYVVFCEEICISEVLSLGVPNGSNNSSTPLNQQTDSAVAKQADPEMSSSRTAVKSGVPEENLLSEVMEQTQDPLAVSAHEEKSILNKLLKREKMELQTEDQESETNAIMSKDVSKEEVASSHVNISSIVPPKGQIMLTMHNGNLVMLKDALPSTVEQMLK